MVTTTTNIVWSEGTSEGTYYYTSNGKCSTFPCFHDFDNNTVIVFIDEKSRDNYAAQKLRENYGYAATS